eukprot:TRINITY_DN15299_c0_g1_i2.p1 TRINITY_DN15299_c0_g1~~TRINITY_DN15299_c0_g1_i2.p1  ORF type:complete len:363 (+),score=45.19 TRINITY_DN15299_c0_g1_i2:66-1154(+)
MPRWPAVVALLARAAGAQNDSSSVSTGAPDLELYECETWGNCTFQEADGSGMPEGALTVALIIGVVVCIGGVISVIFLNRYYRHRRVREEYKRDGMIRELVEQYDRGDEASLSHSLNQDLQDLPLKSALSGRRDPSRSDDPEALLCSSVRKQSRPLSPGSSADSCEGPNDTRFLSTTRRSGLGDSVSSGSCFAIMPFEADPRGPDGASPQRSSPQRQRKPIGSPERGYSSAGRVSALFSAPGSPKRDARASSPRLRQATTLMLAPPAKPLYGSPRMNGSSGTGFSDGVELATPTPLLQRAGTFTSTPTSRRLSNHPSPSSRRVTPRAAGIGRGLVHTTSMLPSAMLAERTVSIVESPVLSPT